MNIVGFDGGTVISLSHTNVKTLGRMVELAEAGQVDPNGGAINRMTQNGLLTIRVEDDSTHYDRPEGGAGPAKNILKVEVDGDAEEVSV